MGVDTKGIINNRSRKTKVNEITVQKAMENLGFFDIKNDVTIKEDGYKYGFISGTINFDGEDEGRQVFYYEAPLGKSDLIYQCYNDPSFTVLEGYTIEEVVNTLGEQDELEIITIGVGKWGHSKEIIKGILEYVGGYIDEDDCDSEEYYEVTKIKEL